MNGMLQLFLGLVLVGSALSAEASIRIRCARGHYTLFVMEAQMGGKNSPAGPTPIFQLYRAGTAVGIGTLQLVEEGYQDSLTDSYVWRFESKDKKSYLEVAIPGLKEATFGAYYARGDLHIVVPNYTMDGSGIPCEVQIL